MPLSLGPTKEVYGKQASHDFMVLCRRQWATATADGDKRSKGSILHKQGVLPMLFV